MGVERDLGPTGLTGNAQLPADEGRSDAHGLGGIAQGSQQQELLPNQAGHMFSFHQRSSKSCLETLRILVRKLCLEPTWQQNGSLNSWPRSEMQRGRFHVGYSGKDQSLKKYSSGQDRVLPEPYFRSRRSGGRRCVLQGRTGAKPGGRTRSRSDRFAEEPPGRIGTRDQTIRTTQETE